MRETVGGGEREPTGAVATEVGPLKRPDGSTGRISMSRGRLGCLDRELIAIATVLTLAAGACSSSGEAAPAPETTTTAVTAPPNTETAPVEPVEQDPITVDSTSVEVYSHGFEQTVGGEWSNQQIGISADGQAVLGPFGTDRVILQLVDLPVHDVLTVEFDLLIMGNWTGGEENGDLWLMAVDGAQVINTTFSNGDGEQAYPADLPGGGNPSGTESSERAWYEFTTRIEGAERLDTRYSVRREFLHVGQQLTIDFAARQLGSFEDQAWAIDNVRVTGTAIAGRRPLTDLVFTVLDQEISISGTVANEADRQLLEDVMGSRFGGRSTVEEVTIVDGAGGGGGPRPLWFYDVATLASVLGPSDDVRLQADETSATASGTVRTSQWAEVYGERLAAVFGDDIQPSTDFEVAFNESFVERLDGLDLSFESTSAELDDEDRATLKQVAKLLVDNEDLILRINGHTDSTGEDDGNKNLSRDRADAANEYLVRAGVDKDRLTANARGDSDLKVSPEQSEADRAANRRVSFVIPRG